MPRRVDPVARIGFRQIGNGMSVLRFDGRAGERFQQQLREDVDQHGHAEQHEAEFKQRARDTSSPVASLNSLAMTLASV